MYFILLSDVIPDANRTGGEIVLYRHLVERKFMDFQIIDPSSIQPIRFWKKWISAFFTYFEKTRLRRWVIPFKFLYDLYDWDHTLIQSLKKNRPEFILTVSHGRGCFKAASLAHKLKVPLVSIFHDFFPYSYIANPLFRKGWEYEVKRMYRQSRLAFVITESMQRKLGKHPNVHILPPIPSRLFSQKLPLNTHNGKLTFCYSGLCGGAYYTMLNDIINVLSEDNNYELHISGAESERFSYVADDNILVYGFLDESKLNQILSESDFLIVLIPFDLAKEHFATHFPSKLVEYAKYGKPIIIWGPDYCTAIKWATENHTAMVINKYDLNTLKIKIYEIIKNKQIQQLISSNAYNYFQKYWQPEQIQHIFVSNIQKLIQK